MSMYLLINYLDGGVNSEYLGNVGSMIQNIELNFISVDKKKKQTHSYADEFSAAVKLLLI